MNEEKVLDFAQFYAWLKRETDKANATLPIGVGKLVFRRRGTSILYTNSGGPRNVAKFYERYVRAKLHRNDSDGVTTFTVRFPECNTWERLVISEWEDGEAIGNIYPVAESHRTGRPGGSL